MARSLVPFGGDISRTLSGFRREMDSLFDHFFREDESNWPVRFSPRTNVAETENEYEVTVELPGMKAEDFDVEILNGQLVIRGEKKHDTEEKNKTYHRVERYYGEFQRVIPLATAVDEKKVSAQYTDGVLRINIAKAEAARPKKISVQGSNGG
jgi:HSP20 family protein